MHNCSYDRLETLPSGALADEIERRGGRVIWEPDDITSVLDWLSNFGMSPEVLEPLERWASEPVARRASGAEAAAQA